MIVEVLKIVIIIVGIILSTSYVPNILVYSIEKKNTIINFQALDTNKRYHIYVLGAGASTNDGIPATTNLHPTTLARLVEGIRIYNYLQKSILITSAASSNILKSQAQITKEAAMILGVKSEKIMMLETPTSTYEEAIAFRERFGTSKNIILVTSALHMPRAVEIFTDQGLTVIPAPTDYLAVQAYQDENYISFPSMISIDLINSYIITVMKHKYYSWFKKPKNPNINHS
ncbi:MAG: YdcF family protein [Flavobacteriaceae bacterium]|nr:YdcF family protein [Flavobacteriaceae bacterium]